MKKCRIAAVLLCSLAAGCTLGPDYQRPELALPQSHRGDTAGAAQGTPFADTGWWQIYRDPQLQALIRDALQNNPDLAIAVARLEQAQAVLGSTRFQLLPTVGIDGGFDRSAVSEYKRSPTQEPISNTWSLQAGVSYELDLWGRLRRLNESARAQLLAAEYNRQAAVASLVSSTATAWFNLVALDEQLKALRDTLGYRQKFLELTQARKASGAANGLEVLSAESQLSGARVSIADVERQIAQTENLISTLAGRNPEALLRQPPATMELLDGSLPPAGLPAQLLERRPDVRAAEAGLISSTALVGATKASLFPTISLTGAFGAISEEFSDLLTGDAIAWSAGGGVVLPLLDAQRNLYQLDAAKARQKEASEQYRKATLVAMREVADALVERQKQAESLQFQQQQTDSLLKARDIAMQRYRIGYSSYFEVITAERDLSAAQLQLALSRRNLQLSVVRLYLALGGGWTQDAATDTEARATN